MSPTNRPAPKPRGVEPTKRKRSQQVEAAIERRIAKQRQPRGKKDPITAGHWQCNLCDQQYSSGDQGQVHRSAANHLMSAHRRPGVTGVMLLPVWLRRAA